MSVISYEDAKQLTLDRLEQVKNSLPASERSRPRYIIQGKSFSVLSLISEVIRNTDVGKSRVYSEMQSLGYAISD